MQDHGYCVTGEHELWRGGSLAGTVVLCGRGSIRLLLEVLGEGVAGVFLARGITLPSASFHRLPRVKAAHAAGQSQSRLCFSTHGDSSGRGQGWGRRSGQGSPPRDLSNARPTGYLRPMTLVGAAPAVTANSAHRGPSGGLPRVEDALAVVVQQPKQHNGFLPHTKTPQGAGQGTRQGWGRQDDQALSLFSF